MGCKSVLDRLKSDLNLSWRSGQATILAAATAAGPVVAQQGADTSGEVNRLDTVHGEPWQPVVVITREDIETCGLTTLDELLSDRANINSFGLRQPLSLGYQILVNGRHPVGSLDLVPLSPLNASKPCVMAPQP